MNCQKCGKKNVNEELICLDCNHKQQLNNNKNNHIDIIDYKIDTKVSKFERMRRRVFNTIILILIITILSVIGLFIYVLKAKTSVKIMNKFNNLRTNSSLLVVYINSKEKNDQLFKKYADYYDYDYIRIDSNLLTRENRKNLKKEFNVKNLNDLIVIYKNSKIIAKKEIKNMDEILSFLNNSKIIPNILKNPKNEIELINNIDKYTEPTLIYIPFVYNELVDSKEKQLKSLSEQYGITYKTIKGYLFSDKQIMKYINQYGYTEMKNELIILMENGEIKKVLEQTYLAIEDYVEIFQNYDIISSISDYLNYIDISEFENLLKNNTKEVFVFGKNDCKYCDNIKYSLGIISKKYSIKIYYIDVKEEDILSKLNSIGYTGPLTYPFTVIVENNKVLDYVIGASEEEYFITFLSKLGIIR